MAKSKKKLVENVEIEQTWLDPEAEIVVKKEE